MCPTWWGVWRFPVSSLSCLFALLSWSFEAFLCDWKMTTTDSTSHRCFVLQKDAFSPKIMMMMMSLSVRKYTPTTYSATADLKCPLKSYVQTLSTVYVWHSTCLPPTSYYSAILLCPVSFELASRTSLASYYYHYYCRWSPVLPVCLTSSLSRSCLPLLKYVVYWKASFSSVCTKHPDLIYHQQNVSHSPKFSLVLVMLTMFTCRHLLLLLLLITTCTRAYANSLYLTVLPQPPSLLLLLPLPSDVLIYLSPSFTTWCPHLTGF